MEQIYQDHARAVYRYLLSLTHDPDLAEELTQETFYQAVASADRFDASCAVRTWLCAIAKNQLAAYGRKHPRTAPLEQAADQPAPEPGPEQALLAGLDRLAVLQRLHQLPDPQREALYLRLFGGLSFREIGEILGKSENWARVTCYRGKERLLQAVDG